MLASVAKTVSTGRVKSYESIFGVWTVEVFLWTVTNVGTCGNMWDFPPGVHQDRTFDPDCRPLSCSLLFLKPKICAERHFPQFFSFTVKFDLWLEDEFKHKAGRSSSSVSLRGVQNPPCRFCFPQFALKAASCRHIRSADACLCRRWSVSGGLLSPESSGIWSQVCWLTSRSQA